MSRKQDVLNLFEFLMDLLKEEEVYEKNPEPKKSVEKPVEESITSKINNGVETGHILQLMKRLDDMDKAKASAYKTLNDDKTLRATLSKQISDTRLSYLLGLTQDVIKEEVKNGSDLVSQSINEEFAEKLPAIQEVETPSDEISLSPDVFTESETPFSAPTIPSHIISMKRSQ